MVVTADTDFIIYAQGENEKYRIRYEVRRSYSDQILTKLRQRLLKSFSLGRDYVDARTEQAATQKAELMQRILDNEFGYTSRIVYIYN